MPQVVKIGVGGDYSTVASWVASSDFSTDWGVGNPATGQITGKITEVVTINTANTPNGALLTAFPGEEYDGTNSATCAGLTSSGITLSLRDLGLEVSNIFIETTANTIAVRVGAFEGVDSNLHDMGCKTGLTGNDASGLETYASAAFTGNVERFVCEGSGGYGIRIRNDVIGTIDHITLIDCAANGSGFRDGIRNNGSSTTIVITNILSLLSATAAGGAGAFDGTWDASSDFNAGDDATAPGSNSLDNRTTADLVNYAGGDFRIASGSALATAGSGGGFIGAFLETSSGISITVTETGPSFTESINSLLTAKLNAAITESGPSFSENIEATLSALAITVDITESGPSFSESINSTVTPNISAAITEVGPSFTEAIGVSVTTSTGITVSITETGPSFAESIISEVSTSIIAASTEQGPSFLESSSISILKEITLEITESGPSFTDSITVALPITITVNPKNIIQVKRNTNNVTIKGKSNTITVKRKSNTIRVN